MRRFVLAAVAAFTVTIWPPVPALAQFSAEDLLRLGVQIFEESSRPQFSPQQPRAEPDRRSTSPVRQPTARSYDPGQVAEIQQRLNQLGYAAGPVDGQMGAQTRRAILDFQRDSGILPSGRPDGVLLGALRSAQPQGNSVNTLGLQRTMAGPSGVVPGVSGPQVADAPNFTILPGYDLPQGDYRSGVSDPRLKGISTAECQQLCAQDGRCQAFTHNERARVCILKDRVLQQTLFAGAVSGIKAGTVLAQAGAPTTEIGMHGVIPTLGGRLLVRGNHGPSSVPSDEAVSQFGTLVVSLALRQFPDIRDNDDHAFGALLLLDDPTQRTIASEAGVDPKKVVGLHFPYWQNLDEFEKRALLQVIRAKALPSLAARAPNLPIPVLVLCSVSFGEYDFERERFPIAWHGAACDSIKIEYGSRMDSLRIRAPFPTAYLPDHIPVPLAEAQEYKRRNLEDSGVMPIGVMAIEAQLIALKQTTPDHPQARNFGFDVKLEGTMLFRDASDLSRPFERLPLIPTSSVATVDVAPIGPVLLDGDTVSLMLLARSALNFGDGEFADWARRRAYDESSGNPGAWAPFFREQVADSLSGGAPPPPDLLTNFAEWTRARAQALPETVVVPTRTGSLGSLDNDGLADGVRIFQEPASHNDPVYVNAAPRLNISPARLALPNGYRARWDANSQGLPGLGPVEFVLVLPATRDEFAMTVDPNSDSGSQLDVSVELRVRDLRIDRTENQLPLVALYVDPVRARVTSDGPDGTEVASATFDIQHPKGGPGASDGATANSAADPAGGMPLKAEAIDLLQLRHLPQTVDDRWIELMMVARHEYEDTMADIGETPIGGWFFRDPSKPLEEPERKKRLAEFREWSTARANSLPETLTLSLEMRNGEAPFERTGESPRDTVCQSNVSQGTANEKEAMTAKLCAYLNAAWATPEPLLYYEEQVTDSAGVGLRYNCGAERYCPEYADYYYNVRESLGLPPAYDLVRLDRLPVLNDATRKLEGELVLEIDVAPTGVTRTETWPDSIWREASRRAIPFDEAHGLRIAIAPSETKPSGPVFIFEAKALAARVVNTKTGETLAEPALAPPPPLPDKFLETVASNVRNLDVLGIKLGMTFEEAERLIRAHMEVGRVFKADRAGQIELATGQIEPYSSGRLFISKAENEAIAIFDEPPAAPGVVLGMWRRLRLPKGSIDPTSLKATLTERYGAPNAIEEASPTGTNEKGVAFLWRDVKHERQDCGKLSQHEQSGRWWREKTGAPGEPPPWLRHYPVLGDAYFFRPAANGEDEPLSFFCPPMLGVWYATYPVPPGWAGMTGQTTGVDPEAPQIKQRADQVAKVAEQMEADRAKAESTADEIMTWLNDQRAYAKLFFESRRSGAQSQPMPQAKTAPQIKF